jgi:hypothetical protein
VVTLKTTIWVIDLSLGQVTRCLDWGFQCFSSLSLSECWDKNLK